MSKEKIGACLIALALALYLAFTAQRGWIMVTQDNLVAKTLGMALFVLPVLGAWALIQELLFGMRIQRLGEQLAAEGGLPPDTLERTPGGRIVRESADADFIQYQRATEAEPEQWRNWYRLGLAYDASGDRRRGRSAMRTAIKVHRNGRLT